MSLPSSIDWEATSAEVTGILQSLLQCDTTNPPGNEVVAATLIQRLLNANGIEAQVLESAPGRGNVVARLCAVNPVAGPLLVTGHLDVVSVERDKWSVDPFGGIVKDGYVWGRGALDMKGQVAAEIMVLLLLKRLDVPLKRDVIFAGFADEEVGEDGTGADWMWNEHRPLIDADFAINEGGGFPAKAGTVDLMLIQTAEKGVVRLRITTHGRPGHGSLPFPDSAMERMGMVLERLRSRNPRRRVTDTVRVILEAMAPGLGIVPDELVHAIENTTDWEVIDRLDIDDASKEDFRAQVTDTIAPTIIRGGQTINVIPSEVTLELDCRTLPGTTAEAMREEVQALIGDLGEVVVTEFDPAIEAEPQSILLDAIQESIDSLLPGMRVCPHLLTGATDAKRMPGLRICGYFPLGTVEKLEEYFPLVHGHDERIAIDDLLFATRALFDLTYRFCAASDT